MRRLLLCVIPVICAAAPLQTPDKPGIDGQELARKIRSSLPQEDSEIHGRLIIRANGTSREVPIVCRVKIEPGQWETDYETSGTNGAQRLVIVYTPDGENQYRFAKTSAPTADLLKPAIIPASESDIPLAGSDFSLADLGLEFLHWPVQRQLKGEMRLGQPCYVLESSNSAAHGVVRVKSYIDKESDKPLLAEGYDAEGHLVKEFSLHGSSFVKVNGRWQLEKMDIRNKKTGSHTELKFDLNK